MVSSLLESSVRRPTASEVGIEVRLRSGAWFVIFIVLISLATARSPGLARGDDGSSSPGSVSKAVPEGQKSASQSPAKKRGKDADGPKSPVKPTEALTAVQRALVIAIARQLYGENHWLVITARLADEEARLLARLTPGQHREFLQSQQDAAKAAAIERVNLTEAIALIERASETQRRLFGEACPRYATNLMNLAELCRLQGEYTRGEVVALKGLSLQKQILGELHPQYAVALSATAALYGDIGEGARAERLYLQALAIYGKALKDDEKQLLGTPLKNQDIHNWLVTFNAQCLNNLATLYCARADFARADRLYRQALESWKQSVGETSTQYAVGLTNLAQSCGAQGDFARAELLDRQALEIDMKVVGPMHPETARCLNNLANLYARKGEYVRAEPLYRQSMEIHKKAHGERHATYAIGLNNLAYVYLSRRNFTQAELLFRQAMEIRTRGGVDATGLSNLGELYRMQGDYARAEPLHRQALEIRKKTLGETHPDCARSLAFLAGVCQLQGDNRRSEMLLREALTISERLLVTTLPAQSERQQLALAEMLRTNLDRYLSVATVVGVDSSDVYRHVLTWKGAVFVRQFARRAARRHTELEPRFDELESVGIRLSTLALAGPKPNGRAVWERQIAELSNQKEALEADLSGKSAEFRQDQALLHMAPADFQKTLPPHVALVDFLEYTHSSAPRDGKGELADERRLVAFVVQKDRPIEQVDFGPAKPLARAVDNWRRAILSDAGGTEEMTVKAADPTHKLPQEIVKELLWNPLRRPLEGVQTVLISPDGVLNQIPLTALPGRNAETYLIEDIKLAVVPVPRLLPFLLEAPAKNSSKNNGTAAMAPADDQSLLIVGDVSYGGNPGKSEGVQVAGRFGVRGAQAGRLYFPQLDYSRPEMAAIRDSFEKDFPNGKVRPLRGENATESAFRREAPNYRWLHLATHGFFAPAEIASALAGSKEDKERGLGEFGSEGISGFHPGLLSGIALSGANTPAAENQDDGILTAVEVAGLNLERAELVVLSACETGLGSVAGGEGMLGLQRSFQLAGAKATVASLWKIPDRATMQFMQRLYENLWDKKLSKLEALRDAQIWMLKEGRQRGLDLEDHDVKKPTTGRLPPRYWAAFVLSGDWR
jgi:CHAT domain-containing protein/tetratricopeptide (TPR) repeat protein